MFSVWQYYRKEIKIEEAIGGVNTRSNERQIRLQTGELEYGCVTHSRSNKISVGHLTLSAFLGSANTAY